MVSEQAENSSLDIPRNTMSTSARSERHGAVERTMIVWRKPWAAGQATTSSPTPTPGPSAPHPWAPPVTCLVLLPWLSPHSGSPAGNFQRSHAPAQPPRLTVPRLLLRVLKPLPGEHLSTITGLGNRTGGTVPDPLLLSTQNESFSAV